MPGGEPLNAEMTRHEKNAMQNAKEWIQEEDDYAEEGNQEEEGEDQEDGSEGEEDQTLQSKVQSMRDTLEDMIAGGVPKEAIEATKKRLKELERKLKVGPIQSIAEIQGARAARMRRHQANQADRERRVEEAQDKIASLRDLRKEALIGAGCSHPAHDRAVTMQKKKASPTS